MSEDTFGKITFSWEAKNEETEEVEKLSFPTVATLKDEASDLIVALNQKSMSGKASVNWAIKYIQTTRETMAEAEYPIPSNARIFVETSEATLEANLEDFETFLLSAHNFTFKSLNKKSNEVKKSTMPIIPVKEKSEESNE